MATVEYDKVGTNYTGYNEVVFNRLPEFSSVAEVLFRTAPENRNWQNRTIKFGSVLFSSGNS